MSGGPGGAFLAGLLAGYGVAVPVGAIAALLVSLTARTSLRVGAAAALGVATADGVYCALAVVGGTAVAHLIEPVSGPLRWAAMVVLLGLAARTAWTAWRHHREGATPADTRTGLHTPGRAYLGLLALTVLNPSTVVYFTALVLGRQGGSTDAVSAVVFVVAAFAASASWQLLLAAGGGLLGRVLTGPRGRFATAVGSSVVIAVLAVGLIV
ncbi:LysE family transporter [Virgisporangium aurantiacum]|uniref:Lysine transporter LysE n=1 Tax=Virgisporangium aurantiacum TaxID=175570 RepID=A0A8J3Z3I1_9ACTN|nr:LysE family transporter [Virgisporangium aurantiacum]GIJ56639.1 lysine transporter LysE [Virgisporangium aurantiacum]